MILTGIITAKADIMRIFKNFGFSVIMYNLVSHRLYLQFYENAYGTNLEG